MNITYDNKENEQAIYQLWQEVFHDPDAFAEYYFQQVYPGNQVIVAKEKNHICSMLHLNPYCWAWEKVTGMRKTTDLQIEAASMENAQPVQVENVELHYIVGVATEEARRRQGLMADCLIKALQDMEANEEPFTYLMPANPVYYEPFQFVMWKQEKQSVQMPTWNYSIFPIRTEEYLTRLQAEVKSEQGDIIKGKNGAYAAYVIDDQKQKIIIQQVFFGFAGNVENEQKHQTCFWQQIITVLQKRYKGWAIEVIESQPMMLRILNLDRFINMLPYQGEEKQLEIQVQDSICKSNEGVIRITLSENGCYLEKIHDVEAGMEIPEWNIGELTKYLLEKSRLADYVYLMEIV